MKAVTQETSRFPRSEGSHQAQVLRSLPNVGAWVLRGEDFGSSFHHIAHNVWPKGAIQVCRHLVRARNFESEGNELGPGWDAELKGVGLQLDPSSRISPGNLLPMVRHNDSFRRPMSGRSSQIGR
eukprot:4148855-Amphidinium_carterae.5